MSLYTRLRPLLFTLPPERAHRLTIRALQALGKVKAPPPDDHILAQRVLGLSFDNPFGMAAGFDKDGEAMAGVHSAGFGFTEIGTLTPLPQSGNPAPRVFRLTEYEALINRLGFNNKGHVDALHRLEVFRASPEGRQARPIGVNIGANKEAEDRIQDYEIGATRFAGPRPNNLADYLTVNISSPNTPGLRDLQGGDAVVEIMSRVRAAAPETPVLVKIAPDLSIEQACEIAELAQKHAIDGLIIANTTLARDGVAGSKYAGEAGGVSGRPVFEMSTHMLSEVYAATGGKLTLIGVGGVSDAQTAYAKICAGASLVQLYTGLIYQGPGMVGQMKRELADRLRADGFDSITDAIGSASV
jgi:dihydroorotate dehydrogenase